MIDCRREKSGTEGSRYDFRTEHVYDVGYIIVFDQSLPQSIGTQPST
jgi:hypothetical protein